MYSIIENRCYSGPFAEEVANVIRASLDGSIAEEQSTTALRCEQDESNLNLMLTKKMDNGLELKPKKFVMEPTSENLASRINDLVAELRKTKSALAETSEELNLVHQENQDMVKEKTVFQEVMLQKVCAILEERNVWIDKFKNMKKDEMDA